VVLFDEMHFKSLEVETAREILGKLMADFQRALEIAVESHKN
jgi:hypothetical protein